MASLNSQQLQCEIILSSSSENRRNQLTRAAPVEAGDKRKNRHWWSRNKKVDALRAASINTFSSKHTDRKDSKTSDSSRTSISSLTSTECVRSASLTEAEKKTLEKQQKRRLKYERRDYVNSLVLGGVWVPM